jgi:nitrite reductase (NADH) large subunit
VEDGLRTHGVQLHYLTELKSIAGQDGRVVAAETANGERVPCQMLAVSIGVLPRKELAEAAGLKCARGVLVDEHLRSSDPDIFAAGDLAEVTDPESGRATLEVLWSSATAKGRVAGLNMALAAGPKHTYEKGAPLNVTRLAGAKVTIIGKVGGGEDADLRSITRGDSETWRRGGTSDSVEWQRDGLHMRVALSGGRISGAVVMGDQDLSFPLQDLISAGADIGTYREQVLAPGAPVAELVSSAWRTWREHHA